MPARPCPTLPLPFAGRNLTFAPLAMQTTSLIASLLFAPLAALVLAAAHAAQCDAVRIDSAAGSFGSDLAYDGQRLLVAALGDGEAFVYERDAAGVWAETAALRPAGPSTVDLIDLQVAISGDVAVIGAPFEPFFFFSGAAYVFERSGDDWVETARLSRAVPELSDAFGEALSLDGETLAIGASGVDLVDTDSGAVFVYERDGGAWTEVASLVGADSGASSNFGDAVLVQGDQLFVGSPGDDEIRGAVYVFEREGGVWSQSAKLVADDAVPGLGFGGSLDRDGDVLAVGARVFDGPATDSGVAYVFELRDEAWVQTARLEDDPASEFGFFGSDVAVSGDTVVVRGILRCPCDDVFAMPTFGCASIYDRAGAGWELRTRLIPSDAIDANGVFEVLAHGDDLLCTTPTQSVVRCYRLSEVRCNMQAGPSDFSASAPGAKVQDLLLHTAPELGGMSYVVLGTTAGTEPGIAVRGVELPLNPSRYLAFTLTHATHPWLPMSSGELDADGNAALTLTVPGPDLALAGVTFHHATVVYDPETLSVQLVSNPTRLTFTD